MALIVPPGFAQFGCAVSTPEDPERMYMTFGLDIQAAAGDVDAVVSKLGNLFQTLWQSVGPIAYETTGYSIAIGQDGGSPISTTGDWPMGPGGGGLAGACVPQNTAFLVKKTAGGGRHGTGRMYVPGVLEDDVSNVGVVKPTKRQLLNDAFGAFLDGLADAGGFGAGETPMYILHGSGGAVPPPSRVTRLVTDQRVGTQRRRLR